MHMLPQRLPGSKQDLSDHLAVSILIDRSLLLEAGKAVLLLLTHEEVMELRRYLANHARHYPINGAGRKGGEE